MVLWYYAVMYGYCTRTRTCTRSYCTRNIPAIYDEIKKYNKRHLKTHYGILPRHNFLTTYSDCPAPLIYYFKFGALPNILN